MNRHFTNGLFLQMVTINFNKVCLYLKEIIKQVFFSSQASALSSQGSTISSQASKLKKLVLRQILFMFLGKYTLALRQVSFSSQESVKDIQSLGKGVYFLGKYLHFSAQYGTPKCIHEANKKYQNLILPIFYTSGAYRLNS